METIDDDEPISLIFAKSRKNDESNNPADNLDNKDLNEQLIINERYYGSCPECDQPNTFKNWCKECNSRRFQRNFGNWTSGIVCIDEFIQNSQLNAKSPFELLEWIPYDRLRDIRPLARGGFSTVFEGIWLDGQIESWDFKKQTWERNNENVPKINIKNKNNDISGYPVALKLNDEDFLSLLNEWKLYLQCHKKARSNCSYLIPLLGITQHPKTSNYMIVMIKARDGSLRNNLLMKKYNQNDKFKNLYYIIKSLKAIHELDLVHGDFHNGNLLFMKYNLIFISDLGLCRPDNQPNQSDIYGVLPYMAPEVLRGKPYTIAADIYSFGIIMWEMTSGIPAFHNISHDFYLSLDICKGKRPEIVEGTMPEYIELMKRCWDNDPEKRPNAKELVDIFEKWEEEYPIETDKNKRIPVPENEPKIIYHPKSCYTSRKFNYSAKLNETLALAQCELSNNETNNMSKSLDECRIGKEQNT